MDIDWKSYVRSVLNSLHSVESPTTNARNEKFIKAGFRVLTTIWKRVLLTGQQLTSIVDELYRFEIDRVSRIIKAEGSWTGEDASSDREDRKPSQSLKGN